MKIYTGSGDCGKTSLFSGERVPKDNERIDAYGDLDELNSVIGALIAALPRQTEDLRQELEKFQSDLFHIGAWLATSPGAPAAAALQPLDPDGAAALERFIDRIDATLPPLTGFILPGGHPGASWAHIARTVCRRTERRVVRLSAGIAHAESAAQLSRAVVYLNRLSDYFFVLARHINRLQGIEDTSWKR
ncbi:MAG: ATP--cob(I)alamin adenosyltransferase [Deltaproteobacteria bacterium]|nr:ATP--cob(I)alamin adenosyltransferase [Deltaproteobacteria bacterium]